MMFVRAATFALLLPLSLNTLSSAQYSGFLTNPNRMSVNAGSVSGTVLGPQGSPAAGIRIELQDPYSHSTVASAWTQQDGTFELYNIPEGRYQVLAQSGISEASDFVDVEFGQTAVTLRFLPSSALDGDGQSISVAQMLVPAKARTSYQKAREAYARGKIDDAKKLLDRALQVYPHFAEALTLRGLIELRANQVEQSQQDFEQAIQYDPNYSTAYVALGGVYNSEGHFDDALRALEHATAISPTVWQGYFEMAKASIGKGLYSKALQLAEKAEQLGGKNLAAIHLLKAYAMIPLKLYSGAKQELQAYVSHEPKGANADQARRLLANLNSAEEISTAKTQ
jgi:Tfp pilus assembly protein PilF